MRVRILFAGGGTTVTALVATIVESATSRASTVTDPLGMSAGAVYTPDESMVPVSALPPVTPFTLQLMRRSVAEKTRAENASVPFTVGR